MKEEQEAERLKKDARERLPELERTTRDLQAQAARMRASKDPLLEEAERTLEQARRLEMWTRDVADGERDRLSVRMNNAVAKALRSGADADWSEAMDRVAMWALDASRPAAFAAAVLDALGDAEIPPVACARVIRPLNFERDALTPGYEWHWEEEAEELSARRAWDRAERLAGLDNAN